MHAGPISFEGGDVVGVHAAVEADLVQLAEDLEHVDVAVVEQHFLETVGRGQAAAHVAEVHGEDLALAAVVVDLVQDERATPGLGARAAAVQVADAAAGEGVDHPVVAQPAERGVGVGGVGRVDGQLHAGVLGDGHQARIHRAEPFPPEVEFLLGRRSAAVGGQGGALGAGQIPAPVRSPGALLHPREDVAGQALAGDGHAGLGEDPQGLARVLQFLFGAFLTLHEFFGQVGQGDAVELQAVGAEFLPYFEEFVEVGVSLFCDSGEVAAAAEVDGVGAELSDEAQVRVREVAVPDGDSYHFSAFLQDVFGIY